jgi:hypothetical protein
MDRKKVSKNDSEKLLASLLTGKRGFARMARMALNRPKRPPEEGEAVPAASPKKPKPIIDGAEVSVD